MWAEDGALFERAQNACLGPSNLPFGAHRYRILVTGGPEGPLLSSLKESQGRVLTATRTMLPPETRGTRLRGTRRPGPISDRAVHSPFVATQAASGVSGGSCATPRKRSGRQHRRTEALLF